MRLWVQVKISLIQTWPPQCVSVVQFINPSCWRMTLCKLNSEGLIFIWLYIAYISKAIALHCNSWSAANESVKHTHSTFRQWTLGHTYSQQWFGHTRAVLECVYTQIARWTTSDTLSHKFFSCCLLWTLLLSSTCRENLSRSFIVSSTGML